MNLRKNIEEAFQHRIPERIPHLKNDTYKIADYIVERPINTEGYDGFGIHWIPCPNSLNMTHPDISSFPLSDIHRWREQTQFPDLEQIDWSAIENESKKFVNRDQKMVTYVSLNGIFERTHLLMGFQNALISYMEEPELMLELCDALADHKIELHKKMYDLVQPDIIVMHDDWGTQYGPFLPPKIFENCIKPSTKRMVEAAKETGYQYIVLHSCGKVESLIKDMIDIGFIGWNSCQPCNDLGKIKRQYGDQLVLLPGLDAQGVVGNPDSTSKELEDEVKKNIDLLGHGGGLIIDSNASYSLNPKNEEVILAHVLDYGRTYCKEKKKVGNI